MNSFDVLKLTIATTIVILIILYTIYTTQLKLTDTEKKLLKLNKPQLEKKDTKEDNANTKPTS